jgi:hypothetical protein
MQGDSSFQFENYILISNQYSHSLGESTDKPKSKKGRTGEETFYTRPEEEFYQKVPKSRVLGVVLAQLRRARVCSRSGLIVTLVACQCCSGGELLLHFPGHARRGGLALDL